MNTFGQLWTRLGSAIVFTVFQAVLVKFASGCLFGLFLQYHYLESRHRELLTANVRGGQGVEGQGV